MSRRSHTNLKSLRTQEQIQRDYTMCCLNIGDMTTMYEAAKLKAEELKHQINTLISNTPNDDKKKENTEYHHQVASLKIELGDALSKVYHLPKDIEKLQTKIAWLGKEQAAPVKTDETTEETTPTHLQAVPDLNTEAATTEVTHAH